MSSGPSHRWWALFIVLLALIVFGVAFDAAVWRIDKAPDILTDEIVYTRAGIRVAGQGALVWDTGSRIYVHPPLYFAVQGLFWRLTGHPLPPMLAAGNIFDSVDHARLVNVFFAGLTAVALFLLGWRLGGLGLGLLLAVLFCLDPFGQRINRRAMLETMAMLLALAGMATFVLGGQAPKGRVSPARSIVAGLLLGAGLLAKEIVFTALVALFLFGLWEAWRQEGDARTPRRLAAWRAARPAFLALAVAVLTYSIYPLWMLSTGDVRATLRMLASGHLQHGFLQVKLLSLERLVGLIQITGWNRSGVSLSQFLLQRLTNYGSSYLLLALGGLATLWLLWRHWQDWTSRFLGTWGLVLYPFYGFVALFGTGNDQFFYLLLVPAMLIVGYAAHRFVADETSQRARRAGLAVAALLLIGIVPYNAHQWWITYGVGNDNAYDQLVQYVDETLPADVPVNASGDITKFWYFFPERRITYAATPAEARAAGVHYFVLAPKDAREGYGRMTPQLAAWIEAEGQLLYTAQGNSYGRVSLYRVDNLSGEGFPPPDAHAAEPGPLQFRPPQSTFVVSFAIALGAWMVAVVVLSAFLDRRRVGPAATLSPEGQPEQRLETAHETT
jgi:4-amino-4-deoxy-L-arabinose transferase-like glycosyltransferase